MLLRLDQSENIEMVPSSGQKKKYLQKNEI